MTRNRLTAGTSASPGDDTSPMKPGDVRTIHDPKSDRRWSLLRTDRDYAHDIATAYNAEKRHADAEWFVRPNGELAFGFPQEFTNKLTLDQAKKRERERQIWLANYRRKKREASA